MPSDDWAVGTRVTRDLEGLEFPACIIENKGDGTYCIVYTDDGNTEDDVPGDELRLDENAGGETAVKESKEALMKNWASPEQKVSQKNTGFDLLNEFNSSQQLNALKAPKVTIHQIEHVNSPGQGGGSPGDTRSRAARPSTSRSHKKAAASAFIINGPETNFAAGRGLRGIRWLRDNPNSY